jgi:uncharacterized protein (TIGR03545 family)
MKFIRWGGLVAFTIIVGGIVGFWYFFADDLLKHAIESAGSDAVEAEVSINNLDISLQPLGIEIKKLEIANAKAPMRNALEFDRAVAQMNLLKLLQGQVIINSLAVEGLRFDTERTRPSTWKKKIQAPPPADTGSSMFDLPDIQLQLPEVGDVLDREDLLTTKMSQQIQLHYDEEQQKLEAAFNNLPDAAKFKSYETRIKEATSGKVSSIDNFKQRKQTLDKVHEEIRADQQAIKHARNQLQASRELITSDIKALKAAPGQDLDNLKAKYKMDDTGIANVSQLFFGGQARAWTQQGLYYYKKLKPLMTSEEKEKHIRATGRYVRFHSDHPTPDFLISDTHIDVQLSFGHLSARLKDITHQMNITGRPTTLTVRGEQLHDMKSFAIDGVFNHIHPGQGIDTVTFKLDDMGMKDLQLVKNEKLPITLTRANIDVSGKLVLEKELTAHSEAQFNPVIFDSHGNSTLGKMFATAFTSIDHFSVTGDIRSNFKDTDIKIHSDIDNQIKQSIKQQWDAKVSAFQTQVKAALDEKEQAIRNRIEGELAKLDQKKAELDNKLNQTEELLKAKLNDYKEEQKQQLEQKKDAKIDKLKESLLNKLKR